MSDDQTQPFSPLEILKLQVEVWKKAIDVQQHFNDLQMRVRNYAITLLIAILGAASVATQYRMFAIMGVWRLPVATLLLMAGALGWVAFYFMDVWWYHRLLKGAVKHAISIEIEVGKQLPGIGLAMAISAASPISLCGHKIRSTIRAHLFYLGIFVLTVAIAMAFVFAGTTTEPARRLLSHPQDPSVADTDVSQHVDARCAESKQPLLEEERRE